MLKVWKQNYELSPSQGEDGRLAVTPGMKDLRLVLDRKVIIRGQLIQADGTPLARFRVNGVQILDDEGRFSLLLPDDEARQLELSAPGFKPVRRTVADPEQEEVHLGTITLEP